MKYKDIVNTDIWKRRIQLPLSGTIRLGHRVLNKSGLTKNCKHPAGEICDFCSHPESVPYFILPDKIKDKFGDKPTKLDIMLPKEDLSEILPKALVWYGATGKKCEGNGQEAARYDIDKREWVKMDCPCNQLKTEENPKGQCHILATFYFFLLPYLGGVYRINISSRRSIDGILNGLDLHKELLSQYHLIPLTLVREPSEITYEDDKGRHTKTIYPIKISSDINLAKAAQLRAASKEMILLAGSKQICLPELTEVDPDESEPEVLADEEKTNGNDAKLIKGEVKDAPMTGLDLQINDFRKSIGEKAFIDVLGLNGFLSYSEMKNDDDKRKILAECKKVYESTKTPQKPAPKKDISTPPEATARIISDGQKKRMFVLLSQLKISTEKRHLLCKTIYKKESTADLNTEQASDFIQKLQDAIDGACTLKLTGKEVGFEYPPEPEEEQ